MESGMLIERVEEEVVMLLVLPSATSILHKVNILELICRHILHLIVYHFITLLVTYLIYIH
jgi:hypothetical protein